MSLILLDYAAKRSVLAAMDVNNRLQRAEPSKIRYIKLGVGSQHAPECFESGELGLAFEKISHELCLASQWEEVRQKFIVLGKSPSKATAHTTELRDFYELGPDVLWITIVQGELRWAFADLPVSWRATLAGGLPRRRTVINGWRNLSMAGAPLTAHRLNPRLTKVAAFRSTICGVEAGEYLLRKLKDEPEPHLQDAIRIRDASHQSALTMIRNLHPTDFELLIDLILSASGWRRVSRLGETQKDIDLLVEQIATNERAFVQVKSRASPSVLEEYIERFREFDGTNRLIFACHSPSAALERQGEDYRKSIDLWFGEEIACRSVRAGLFDWLIQRTS